MMSPARGARGILWRAVFLGYWRRYPGRTLLSIVGVMLGVSLGMAVTLINRAALTEFTSATRALAGTADYVIRGPVGGFSEALFARLARNPDIEALSPVVEVETRWVNAKGQVRTLRVLGIDPLRAAHFAPAYLNAGSGARSLLEGDTILLTKEASSEFGIKPGQTLTLGQGSGAVALRVIGHAPDSPAYDAITDIATAQWRFGKLGYLTRLDLKVRGGASESSVVAKIAENLPAGVFITRPEVESDRIAETSRAYRINLGILALISLFTGGFLVFITQLLAVQQRRRHLALLRTLGMSGRRLRRILIGEGALVGLIGSLLGIVIGYVVAAATTRFLSGDLGGGYFSTVSSLWRHVFEVGGLYLFLGTAISLIGAWIPATTASRTRPADALRSRSTERQPATLRGSSVGLMLILVGLSLSLTPPVAGLPVFGYLSIASLLIGAVFLTPWLATFLSRKMPLPGTGISMIAAAQLRASSRWAALGAATILVSFSFMVAMAIMVYSFRTSVTSWLDQLLPADLYIQAGTADQSTHIDPAMQRGIESLPGVARVSFLQSRRLYLQPDEPPVTLLARPISRETAPQELPLMEEALEIAPDVPPVWISEGVADTMGWTPGEIVTFPVEGQIQTFQVAGIWRDYARQNGSLLIDRDTYIRMTGDRLVNSAAIWVRRGATAEQISASWREQFPQARHFELGTPGSIRQETLRIFDRTFLVTYLLEGVAVLIGLFGISSTFSALVIERRREFGMLRHIGMSKRQLRQLLTLDGLAISTLGTGYGLVIGGIISVILIEVVNRQAFRWSMDMHIPWGALVTLALALVATSTLVALLSGRGAATRAAVMSVKEDW